MALAPGAGPQGARQLPPVEPPGCRGIQGSNFVPGAGNTRCYVQTTEMPCTAGSATTITMTMTMPFSLMRRGDGEGHNAGGVRHHLLHVYVGAFPLRLPGPREPGRLVTECTSQVQNATYFSGERSALPRRSARWRRGPWSG